MEIWNLITDALFPRRCPVCDDIVAQKGELICPGCSRQLEFIHEPVCRICGREITDETEELCRNCKKHSFTFEYNMSLLQYNEAAARSLAAVKYRGRREYLEYYAAEIIKRVAERIRQIKPDALVPVPVHASRKKMRGFNQAEVLARHMGEALGIPVITGVLKRKRKTTAQKQLGAEARFRNLNDAFACTELPEDMKCILVIDDIFTTGATMEAVTRILKKAGAERVYGICICARSDN